MPNIRRIVTWTQYGSICSEAVRSETEIGLRCRDVAQTRAKKGSDFEGRDKTPPLGHPATTYFQGTGDSFELSSKSLTRTSTDEGMQHSRGGRFADFLDEFVHHLINY